MTQTAKQVVAELKKHANPSKAKVVAGFFKTGPGEYGEGDSFWGINVPQQREIARAYRELPLSEIPQLLAHKTHEVRLTGLLLLVQHFERADEKTRGDIVRLYLRESHNINNWDMIDLSAPNILGTWLLGRDKKVLYRLAKSKSIWERRIAIVATFAFIRKNQFTDTLQISEVLLRDAHDLLHKACGWMLREVGKRSPKDLRIFLDRHSAVMPRTMLRYAIERMSGKEKHHYMAEGKKKS
jgi:3-methyladenine DNA glycosylase AlkD